jgi:hypothetical protein
MIAPGLVRDPQRIDASSRDHWPIVPQVYQQLG